MVLVIFSGKINQKSQTSLTTEEVSKKTEH